MFKKIIIPAILLTGLFIQGLYFAWDTGQTVDETFYNGSGYRMVRYNDYQMKTEHPPLMTQLGALPLLFLQPTYPISQPIYVGETDGLDNSKMGSKFLYESGNDAHLILFLERVPMVLLTLFLGILLYSWSRKLFGIWGALLSLALFSFSPNLIAHGSLYTTDLGITAFFFFVLYRLKLFFESPSIRNIVILGIASGLALLTKMTALILAPMMMCLFFLFLLLPSDQKQNKPEPNQFKTLDPILAALGTVVFLLAISQKVMMVSIGPLCLLAVSLTLVPALQKKYPRFSVYISFGYWLCWVPCFIFLAMIAQKRSMAMTSSLSVWVLFAIALSLLLKYKPIPEKYLRFAKLFSFVWLIAVTVVIFGYTDLISTFTRLNPFRHYIESFQIAFSHIESHHRVCVDGSFVTCDWKYFVSAMAVKTPILTLGLFFLGMVAFFKGKIKVAERLVILLPFAVFLGVASFLNQINIGIRHVLPLYPIMFLVAGGTVPLISRIKIRRLRQITIGVLLLLLSAYGIRNLIIFPHYLSYFNEWVGNAQNGARLVSDSNLNWGQDNKRLAEVVRDFKIQSIRILNPTLNGPELSHYGVRWDYMQESDLLKPAAGFYVIDVNTYVMLNKGKGSWFSGRKPFAKAGETLYLFQVPDNGPTHLKT